MIVATAVPAVVNPAPAWLRDLVSGQTDYQEVLGWPVTVQVATRRLVIPTGEQLDALIMPRALGEKVLTEQRITMLVGPVIADAEDQWWTFLTERSTVARLNLPADVRELRVHAVPRGATVVIPNRADTIGSARWVERPRPHRPLPPWSGVVGTIRRIIAHNTPASQCADAKC